MTAFLLISTGILLLIAVPIGMAMGTASLLTILQGGTLNALIITQKLLSGVSKFSLLAIPMFTLAGEVMTLGGVSDKLIYLANRVVGRFKGGLSMVTTLACMFFGAISGSATATAAAIGGIMVPKFMMPAAMQTLAEFSPMAWGLQGFHTIMLRHGGFADILQPVVQLLAFAAANVIGIGINGTDAIGELKKANSGFYGSMLPSPHIEGYKTAEMMFEWVTTGKEPPKYTAMDEVTLITRANFQEELTKIGLWK